MYMKAELFNQLFAEAEPDPVQEWIEMLENDEITPAEAGFMIGTTM
jgi:hypothetical protein